MDSMELVKTVAPAVGVAQPFILRKMVFAGNDTVLVPQMGKYGKTSSVVNMAASGAAIAAAVVGKYMRKGITNEEHQDILIAYGVPALATGLLLDYFEGATPTSIGAPTRMFARSASAPMVVRPYASESPVVNPPVVQPPMQSRGTPGTAERNVY